LCKIRILSWSPFDGIFWFKFYLVPSWQKFFKFKFYLVLSWQNFQKIQVLSWSPDKNLLIQVLFCSPMSFFVLINFFALFCCYCFGFCELQCGSML
jgi:hypothetical protein